VIVCASHVVIVCASHIVIGAATVRERLLRGLQIGIY
jgi:hypothetical protein